MPLNAAALASAIEGEIRGYAGEGNTTLHVASLAQAIAVAVVGHLQAYGTVVGVCPSGGGPLAGGKIT
ncbi:MAG TPA: hypothetical protein VGB92_25850 [Longimicrobium sp.]|jgi:hypothetical protein